MIKWGGVIALPVFNVDCSKIKHTESFICSSDASLAMLVKKEINSGRRERNQLPADKTNLTDQLRTNSTEFKRDYWSLVVSTICLCLSALLFLEVFSINSSEESVLNGETGNGCDPSYPVYNLCSLFSSVWQWYSQLQFVLTDLFTPTHLEFAVSHSMTIFCKSVKIWYVETLLCFTANLSPLDSQSKQKQRNAEAKIRR